MPSRAEHHHHDSGTASTEQKTNTSQSSPTSRTAQPVDTVSRNPTIRPKRMRFTSGNGNSDNVGDEAGHHRTRRTSHVASSGGGGSCAGSSRHSKQTPRTPSSLPSSPNASSPVLDPSQRKTNLILDTLVAQNDVPGIGRVDQLEDENSFSSSVFSEHMVSADLVINPNKDETLKLHHSPLLPPSSHRQLVTDDDDDEEEEDDDDDPVPDGEESDLGKKLASDVEGLLIHGDSEMPPSTLNTADDAASSEGEDEKEPTLIPSAADVLHLSGDPDPNEIHVASVDRSALLPSSCMASDCDFTAVLGHASCNCAHADRPSPDGHENPTVSTRLLSDPMIPYTSSLATTANQRTSTSSPTTQISPNPTRMTTRSQTAVLTKHDSPLTSSLPSTDRGSRVSGPCCFPCNNCNSPSPSSSCASSSCSSSVPLPSGSSVRSTRTRPLSDPCPTSSVMSLTPRPTTLAAAGPYPVCCDSPSFPSISLATSTASSSTTTTTTDLAPNRRSQPDYAPHLQISTTAQSISSPVSLSNPSPYPLRSRLRHELRRKEWDAAQRAPKSFGQMPTEVLFRIAHYLPIQEVFRLQLVNHRMKAVVERYLLLVKRINFSNGLPFAFLPESVTDASLRRILSHTPEVTHILGFYPKRIYGSHPMDAHSLGANRPGPSNALTYAGIVSAFRMCTRLRSVELMDVELMSKLVHFLPRIKFHGMFRNRPDSWDSEYAVALPSENFYGLISSPTSLLSSSLSSLSSELDPPSRNPEPAVFRTRREPHIIFSTVSAISAAFPTGSKTKSDRFLNHFDFKQLRLKLFPSVQAYARSTAGCVPKTLPLSSVLAYQAALDAQTQIPRYSVFASWFEPIGEAPIGSGSPSTMPHFLPTRPLPFPPRSWAMLEPGQWDAIRNLALAPYLQFNLPPIEAELMPTSMNPLADRVSYSSPFPNPPLQPQHASILALAFGAIFVQPGLLSRGLIPPVLLTSPGLAASDTVILARHPDRRYQPHDPFRPRTLRDLLFETDGVESRPGAGTSRRGNRRRLSSTSALPALGRVANPWFVSPLPGFVNWIGLPHAISNLTKLDLVSVAISTIPRLDNIKYLHLKWVSFSSADPFLYFSANKLQSFVMNNCCGPSRVARFVRIFSALARAPQLARLELVGIPFVDGLLSHIIDVPLLLPSRGFRNLQRLVLAGNKDSREMDVGLLLLAAQHTLNHLALQATHTCNSLFEALLCAHCSFPRLEYLVLGYQDPYQSRLTISELVGLGLSDSSDHLNPLCQLTDHGLMIALRMCPRLAYLTIRHAPYLCSLLAWNGSDLSSSMGMPPLRPGYPIPGDGPDRAGPHTFTLRSLTLENCPGVLIDTLEIALASGVPFPLLETLVLRDMFAPRSSTVGSFVCRPTWTERISRLMNPFDYHRHNPQQQHQPPHLSDPTGLLEEADWRLLSQLLALNDLLATKRFGYSAFGPDSIGLSSSVRDVSYVSGPIGLYNANFSLKPFDLVLGLRLHHYLSSLLELDGSCGPQSLGHRRVLETLLTPVTPSRLSNLPTRQAPEPAVDFVSQSTQTCLCGLLEWHLYREIFCDTIPLPPEFVPDPAAAAAAADFGQLGGPLAFHPYTPSLEHVAWYRLITDSDWGRSAWQAISAKLTTFQSRVYVDRDPCSACASQLTLNLPSDQSRISARQPERNHAHRTRKWIARDAIVDTSTLRCHLSCEPLVFTLYQAPQVNHNHLTTIHFEKVGITHLVLCSAPHLKNLTLENCTQLQAIVFHPVDLSEMTYWGALPDLCPFLRRIRVLRCPRFAIYQLLHAVASLYPAHEENISITFRPFGQYNQQIERALWSRAQHAHVLVSHDYKQRENERQMEEFHSTFDQLFREVINFSDMLVRRDLLAIHPKPFGPPLRSTGFRRSEHGSGWDVVTDIPWIHEICCSLLRTAGTDAHRRSDQADQFYEILSEIQSNPTQLKIQRRGIHLHVQYRDVHHGFRVGIPATCDRVSYLSYPYTEQYLASTHPMSDQNAAGDGFNESVLASMPNSPLSSPQTGRNLLLPWQKLLLSQDETVSSEHSSQSSPPVSKRPRRSSSSTDDTSPKLIRLEPPAPETIEPRSTRPRVSHPSGSSITTPASRKRPSVAPDSRQPSTSKRSRLGQHPSTSN